MTREPTRQSEPYRGRWAALAPRGGGGRARRDMTDLHAGRFARTADAVERVTGLPPRTLEGWCRAHVGAFR